MDDNFEDDDFVSDHLEEDDEEWDEWTPNDDDAFDFESWNNAISDNASFEPIERDHGVTVDDADDIYGASTRARRLAGGLITIYVVTYVLVMWVTKTIKSRRLNIYIKSKSLRLQLKKKY